MVDQNSPYRFIYEPSEFIRIVQGVTIDARSNIPILVNAIGSVFKVYIDAETAKIKDHPEVLFFRIETLQGVLAGYFSLQVNPSTLGAILYQYLLRPSFIQFNAQISAEIVNFIGSNTYKQFYL